MRIGQQKVFSRIGPVLFGRKFVACKLQVWYVVMFFISIKQRGRYSVLEIRPYVRWSPLTEG